MTPEARDLVRGARQTIEAIVLPALSDPFAIEQAKTVLRVLAHLEATVDDAYPLEWEEARDLERFLALADSSERKDAPAELPPYRELREANVARKARIAELIRGGREAALGEAFDDLIRRQLARERAWTSPGRGGGKKETTST